MQGNEVVIRISAESKPGTPGQLERLDGLEVAVHQLEVSLERAHRVEANLLRRIERLLLLSHPDPVPQPTRMHVWVSPPLPE